MNIIEAREALLRGERVQNTNGPTTDEAIMSEERMVWKKNDLVVPMHFRNIHHWEVINEPKYIDRPITDQNGHYVCYPVWRGIPQIISISLSCVIEYPAFEGYVYEGGYVLNVPVAYKQHSRHTNNADFSPRKTDQHYIVARPIAVRFKK